MLSKRDYLKKLFNQKRIFFTNFSVKYLEYSEYKTIFLVKRTKELNAVKRNKIKRIIRNSTYQIIKKPNFCIVFYLELNILKVKFNEIIKDMHNLKQKLQ